MQWPKDKRQTIVRKTLHTKLKIGQSEPHLQQGVDHYLTFCFWPLHCLSVFDGLLLISSNFLTDTMESFLNVLYIMTFYKTLNSICPSFLSDIRAC
jgi:hypothetical protein